MYLSEIVLEQRAGSKLAPESLVYEYGEVIIPPNEKVVFAASVKWTKLSRKAPYTYSPFNSYSPFNTRGKCFCNLFICRCCESRLLLQYLRLSSPFFTSTVTQTVFFLFFFQFSFLFEADCPHKDGCVFSGRWPRCCSVYPAHTSTPGPLCLAWWANAWEKHSAFRARGKGCVF